jgi:subtilase family serine protease
LRPAATQGTDYRVIAVSDPPASGSAGYAFSISDTTKNFGLATETTSDTDYYLSKNAKKDAGDTFLSDRGLVGLAKHEANSGGLNLHVPDPIASGSYYVIACADANNAIAELNENNNCRASAAKIAISKPDYRITSLSNPPATGNPGTTFAIFDTNFNAGGSTSTTTYTNYYLSTDATKDGGDTILGGRGLFGLDNGASNSGGLNAHVPADMASGTYFALACADETSALAETNENNNRKKSATKIVISPA